MELLVASPPKNTHSPFKNLFFQTVAPEATVLTTEPQYSLQYYDVIILGTVYLTESARTPISQPLLNDSL